MANNNKGCCCRCCIDMWCDIWAICKRSIPIIIVQLIGWALFSYVEDDFSVIDCFSNPENVAAKVYPPSNELRKAVALFYRLYNKTGLELSQNQSAVTYSLFKTYLNVPNQVTPHKDFQSLFACVKWYRFSVLTMTTIGYGVITPKSVTGKMLLIPYALLTIPMMLTYLAFIGSMVSKWAEEVMFLVHRCIKGDKPLRYKLLKRSLYLFLAFWIVSVIAMANYGTAPTAFESTGAMRWLDGFYFMLVTFTTIGFGDLTGPADDIGFFTWYFAVGLAVISGFMDSMVSLTDRVKFSLRGGKRCFCIHYVADDDEIEPKDDTLPGTSNHIDNNDSSL